MAEPSRDRRTDSASRVVAATAADVYAALVDPEAWLRWLPPAGMTGRIERFDACEGGVYAMVLTYADPAGGSGKASIDSDVVEGRFVELNPGKRVVHDVEFPSDDPAYAGTMRMIWSVDPTPEGTEVTFRAEDVPPGIDRADHQVGMDSSLANLAAYVE